MSLVLTHTVQARHTSIVSVISGHETPAAVSAAVASHLAKCERQQQGGLRAG